MLHSLSPLSPPASAPRKLRPAIACARRGGAVEHAADFGRWWFDADSAQIVLSAQAARFLEVEAGLHRNLEDCLIQVLPDDVLRLVAALSQVSGQPVDCEFRIVNELDGLRWLRMQSLPPASAAQRAVRMGVVTDVTAARHAALRERVSFESTQILIGTSNLEGAVTKVIELVCETLGWEWGAFWTVDPARGASPVLACSQFWHAPHFQLAAFTRDSQAVRMGAGEGLVGRVWGSGEAGWVEDIANNPGFLRRKSAAECGLLSGYAFPVAYVGADGARHSPGVLEFFSTLARQREAQLPNLSTAIGTLIAQTEERYAQQAHAAAMEESLRRCHRALRVIHDCEQVIASSADERSLLQGVCNVVAVGYRMAWAALLDGDGGSLRLAGITGAHQDYLDCLAPSLAAGEAGHGTLGAALRSRGPVVVNDFERDARLAPWWTDAAQRGFRAKVALPLFRHEETLGVLNIYSAGHGAFDPEEVSLLQGLADRVAATVQGHRHREARQDAQAALRLRDRALAFQAHYDELTGLPNRVLLHERLGQVIADRARPAWLVYLDLDRFKLVNDSLGYQAGDVLLIEVAQRLRAAAGPADTVARLGGDEFGLILHDPQALPGILEAVARPLAIEGHEFFPSCSMGVATWPGDGEDEASLVRHADIAMYRAKELGRNNYQFYSAAMNARALERLHLESQLRHAIARGQFVLHYQPQVAVDSGRIVGMEALIRWNHPELGMVPPSHFIGLAEETGMIVAIGDWVLRTACAQNKAWQRAGYGGLRVAVNLSARQFGAQDLAASIIAVLEESGLAADSLDIELTESSLMADVDAAVASMRALKAIGVRLSIDDFGTGYSSLSYLKRFPIDVLKIDKSFVRDVMSDPGDAAIVASVISLAHQLKMHVIAEGVETAGQLDFLRRHGCDDMQGYLFSEPVPAAAFERMLAAARGAADAQ